MAIGKSSTIVVRVLGNTKGLTKSLKRANDSLGGLDRTAAGITSTMRVAAIATAGVAAAAVGAGAVGAAALLAIPLAMLGIGVVAAAQSAKVQTAFTGMATKVKQQLTTMAAPLEPVLVAGAAKVQKAFDKLAPHLTQIFAQAAPILAGLFDQLGPLAEKLGPMLERGFAAGIPVLQAFVKGLGPLTDGLASFFVTLENPAFAAFITELMSGVSGLLPPLGAMLVALTPLGTTILEVLLPALADLFTWIAEKLSPAITDLTAWMIEHQTAVKAVALVLAGLVVTVKAVQLAMSLASAATLIFSGVANVVRAAIIVWKNAQLALNLAMYLNPIGLIVVAVIALIAVFVLAYKKCDWFRAAVDKVWAFMKRAAGVVWDWIAAKVSGAVAAIGGFLTRLGTWFRNLPGNLLRLVVGAHMWLIQTGIDLIMGLLRGIGNGAKSLWTWLSGLGSTIMRQFVYANTWLISAGYDLIQGFITGITRMFGNVKSTLQDLTNKLTSWKGPPSKDKRLLTPAGQLVIQSFIDGIDKSVPKVKSALAKVTDVVQGYGITAGGTTTLKVARPAFAGAAGGVGGAAGSRTYQITVQAPVGASSADIGRSLVKHIEEFERVGGRKRV